MLVSKYRLSNSDTLEYAHVYVLVRQLTFDLNAYDIFMHV